MIRLRNFEDSKFQSIEIYICPLFSFEISKNKSTEDMQLQNDPQKTCNYKMTKRMSNEFRNNGTTTKTIYAIYYEDVKPVIKDLQSVPLCSHVLDATSMLKTLT